MTESNALTSTLLAVGPSSSMILVVEAEDDEGYTLNQTPPF